MGRKLILVSCVVMPLLLAAQTVEPLIFREKVYDFGDVVESNGNADYEFVFTNNTGRPVKIVSVNASCGCTTPGWSQLPIPPGKTGFVKASFDPKGRPGYFNKSLTVVTDFDANPLVLQIKGQVVSGKPVVDFNVALGNLYVTTKSFNMGTVYLNKPAAYKEFPIMNTGPTAIRFLSVEKPDYMQVETPRVIGPQAKGYIRITYDGVKKNKFGFSADNIVLVTDDPGVERKSISLFAMLEEYYQAPSADELLSAPQAALREQSIDLGQSYIGTTLERKVTLINSGKRELKIKALQGNCVCISALAEHKSIRGGDSTSIRITFKPQSRGGTQQKAITLYTNDPRNPVQLINVLVFIGN